MRQYYSIKNPTAKFVEITVSQSKLQIEFWLYSLKAACYVLNCSIARKDFKSPVELLVGKKFNVTKIRVFGSVAYRQYIPKQFRNKLSEKGKKCIFIGYTKTG